MFLAPGSAEFPIEQALGKETFQSVAVSMDTTGKLQLLNRKSSDGGFELTVSLPSCFSMANAGFLVWDVGVSNNRVTSNAAWIAFCFALKTQLFKNTHPLVGCSIR